MIGPVWKLISLFLALGTFLAAGIYNISSGEDLMWTMLKASGAFLLSWIVLGQLGKMLLTVLGRQEESLVTEPAADGSEAAPRKKRGK